MSDTTMGPTTAKGALWAVVAAVLVVGLLWGRPTGSSASSEVIKTFAEQCPRWVKLAEDLLPADGAIPERCEYVQSGDALFSADHLFKASPNIRVQVFAKDADPRVPTSVEISDVRSKASVTYNAEALALLK